VSQSHDSFAPTITAIADSAVAKFTGVKFVASTDGKLHCVPATTGVCHGIAQTDCAVTQEVTVKTFAWGYMVLADGTTAIAVGDPLVITGAGATKATGTPLADPGPDDPVGSTVTYVAFDGIAIEALPSGAGVIEFMPVHGTTAVTSA
jgi:predicted transcriptional regulator